MGILSSPLLGWDRGLYDGRELSDGVHALLSSDCRRMENVYFRLLQP